MPNFLDAPTLRVTFGSLTLSWRGFSPFEEGQLTCDEALPPPGEEQKAVEVVLVSAFEAFAQSDVYRPHGGAPPLEPRSLLGFFVWVQDMSRRYAVLPDAISDPYRLLAQVRGLRSPFDSPEEPDKVH
jgi:hypothetical protein